MGVIHLNAGEHSNIVAELTGNLSGTVVDVRGVLHLNFFTSPDILISFTRVHGLRLYGDTRKRSS